MRHTLLAQLATWGESVGFGPVEPDAEGFAALEDDAGMLITLYLPEGASALKALVDLGLPPEEEAGEFYEILLINNFGARPEAEGILAREESGGHLLLTLRLPLEALDAEGEVLDAFLQRVSFLGNRWRNQLAVATLDEDDEAAWAALEAGNENNETLPAPTGLAV